MSQIIRINMTELEVNSQEASPEYVQLGGRALSSHIIATEVPPNSHPLTDLNKLIIAPGLLAGTITPNSGRLSFGAKSPLTQGIKEANVGGTAAQKLARLGIKALIIEGKPKDGNLYVIKIDRESITITPEAEFAGMLNYNSTKKIFDKFGEKVSIICIGPAGEMKMAAASIAVTDPNGYPSRHAARGGLGAVMGTKGVKAVVINDENLRAPQAFNKEVFQETCKEFSRYILESKATKLLSQYGTVGGLPYMSKLGTLPTRNYSSGSFEGKDHVGGKGVAAINAARGGSFGQACMFGCIVRCSNIIHDKNGNFLTAGFEYESSAMLSANLGIDDLDTVFEMEKMCDNLGLDTMEIGAALGIASEAGIFTFGDGQSALDLIRDIGKGTVLGRVIGQGAEVTARVFGISRVPVVKGQALPAHDPRTEIGTGIGYATSPQGADHTGIIIFDNLSTEELIEKSHQKQTETCVYDSLGICQMAEPTLEIMTKLINSFYGWDWSLDDITNFGKTVLKKELEFNRKAGLGPETDRLPDFCKHEKLPPHLGTFNIDEEQIDKFWNFLL